LPRAPPQAWVEGPAYCTGMLSDEWYATTARGPNPHPHMGFGREEWETPHHKTHSCAIQMDFTCGLFFEHAPWPRELSRVQFIFLRTAGRRTIFFTSRRFIRQSVDRIAAYRYTVARQPVGCTILSDEAPRFFFDLAPTKKGKILGSARARTYVGCARAAVHPLAMPSATPLAAFVETG
jgi:hypothetical protein